MERGQYQSGTGRNRPLEDPKPATPMTRAPNAPKVAAIVMTMVGSKSQVKATPDQASRMYIERAIAIAEKYPNVFGLDDPSDAFVLTDDFHSAGRISGRNGYLFRNSRWAVSIAWNIGGFRSTNRQSAIRNSLSILRA